MKTMNVVDAFKIALSNSEFIEHDNMVKLAEQVNALGYAAKTACLLFCIDEEVFYYGFDGVRLHKGKHTPARSAYMIRNHNVLKIR
jgi:hypothetical protein